MIKHYFLDIMYANGSILIRMNKIML